MSEVLGFRHRLTGEPIALARLFGDGEPSIHLIRHEVIQLKQFTLVRQSR